MPPGDVFEEPNSEGRAIGEGDKVFFITKKQYSDFYEQIKANPTTLSSDTVKNLGTLNSARDYGSKPLAGGIIAAVGAMGAATVGAGAVTTLVGSLGLTSDSNAPVTTYINALAKISDQLTALDNGG